MSTSTNSQTPKASWALFEGLFIIAALVAVFATFIAISGATPNDPTAGATPWLLGLNFVLLVVLAVIVVREYLKIRGSGSTEGGGRLAQRFVLLFGFSALIPAMVVAVFMGAFITRGLDRWIGERVDELMKQNTEIFRSYVDNFQSTFESDTRLAAMDVENFAKQVDQSLAGSRTPATPAPQVVDYASTEFFEGLQSELAIRELLTIAILGPDGIDLIAEASVQDPILLSPPKAAFLEADQGAVATTLYEGRGIATALIKISAPVDGYIYAAKVFDRNAARSLREAETALEEYNAAKRNSGRLQAIFAIGYTQIVGLVLLLAGRLGLEAAGRITGPIGRLAAAAQAVRDGDLGVRVPVTGPVDEVHELSSSFNAMTSQLSGQQNALIRARNEEEDRRRFVETLLGEIGAGVIRVDREARITLANRSACEILGLDQVPEGAMLGDVAPAFERIVRDTFERNAAVDASLELTQNGELRSVRLKSAPEPSGGCVLTFDDTTRLINAQRQLAWRDVARRIAHEIRNPLTPIMLATERLRRRYGSKIDDTDGVFDRSVDTILRKVDEIARMVEEFSSFARMPKPSIAPFDMKKLLQGASFAQSVVSPEIEIELESDLEDAPFLGDERLLAQAFGNLLKNAAEAIEGQPIENDVSGHIRIILARDPGGLVIAIEDNGPGFPVDVRNRLLEPYVTTREKGTGLGLAIVNRIIADHGGSISLQNRPDGLQGARVRIVLPENGALAMQSDHASAGVLVSDDGHEPGSMSL
ncbi:MAG: HAMP domain-containing protein [Hyphomonas sp.]|uniref:sensor histidine kinase n=1 Tax=Hyphomonas sp. TaxID=87 RepID=UPI0018521CD5|nr:ATP-binding protein [Hyphomonas sp.]MBA3067188.1 HAMP domain-containing protein [Hyphomonas sp.]MBU3921023.1 HAMP domain-containing protein [Alphaproteobacteria bacterium]MBU4061202.1 HAMP domain-containing protein [Alphaproteobacteria bacterium]MBU4165114.1 HAMP domain-containing protein [Alphaproteobacteria bacterium]